MPDIVRVGGLQYSWVSTMTRIDGQPYRGLTSLDFSDKLDVETVYSQTQDGVPIGDTEGQYSVDSFTMKWIREYADYLTTYLAGPAPGVPPGNRGGPGEYGGTHFSLTLTAIEPLQILAVPLIILVPQCRIIGVKETTEKGSAALETEFTCWARQIIRNGKTLYKQAIPGL